MVWMLFETGPSPGPFNNIKKQERDQQDAKCQTENTVIPWT